MIIYLCMLGKDGLYLITDAKEVGYLTGYQTPDGYAVFDGYFSYSERTEKTEVTTVITEPDGSVVRHTETKKTAVPVLSVHGGCFLLNLSEGSKILSSDGETLLQSDVTALPAGVSFDGSPLFLISGRIVTSSGKGSAAAEPREAYTLSDGTVYGSDGKAVSLPTGFSFAGSAGIYMIVKSDATGLYGVYSPAAGWIADPVYRLVTSAGSTAFAAETARGAVLVSYSGEELIAAGVFGEINVSGTAACAYSESTGWVAFDLTEA